MIFILIGKQLKVIYILIYRKKKDTFTIKLNDKNEKYFDADCSLDLLEKKKFVLIVPFLILSKST